MDPSEYDKMYRLEEANWWYLGRRNLVLKMAARFDNGLSGKPLRILDAVVVQDPDSLVFYGWVGLRMKKLPTGISSSSYRWQRYDY